MEIRIRGRLCNCEKNTAVKNLLKTSEPSRIQCPGTAFLQENIEDLDDVAEEVKERLTIIPVSRIEEVLEETKILKKDIETGIEISCKKSNNVK